MLNSKNLGLMLVYICSKNIRIESSLSDAKTEWVHEGFYTITPDCAAHGEDNRGLMLNMDVWLETVGDIDILIEYAKTLKQADANRFGIFGISMGGSITFLYGAKGKNIPSVLLPEVGTPDFTGLRQANCIMNQGWIIGNDTFEVRQYFMKNLQISESALKEVENYLNKTKDNITKKAQEISPVNYIERFINIPMYAKFGGNDDQSGIAGVRLFNEKLKEAGATIQKLIILEGYGHGGFPDDYDERMSYVKKSMGMKN